MEIMTILIILALIATIVSLGWGVGSMAMGSDFDHKHDVQFMSARVGFQAIAIVLLLFAIVVSLQ
ncbi:MAG TPA: twin transmembrane helix small protein [Gammaproteobacteria bacterium]|nr:twin transmembrane helix small protein [Gammaproteobacteria bacterium]